MQLLRVYRDLSMAVCQASQSTIIAFVPGANQKARGTIATKACRTSVSMEEGASVSFSLVAEDMVYPVSPDGTGHNYVSYIGFDPQALKPEPRAPVRKKK